MNYILYLFVYHIKNNTGRDHRFSENTKYDDLFINKSSYYDRFINHSDLDETIFNKCNEDLEKQKSYVSITEEYLKYNKNLYYDLFLGLDYF